MHDSLMRFKNLNKNQGKTYLYFDRDGNRLTEEDLKGYDPLVFSIGQSTENPNEVFVYLDVYASQIN